MIEYAKITGKVHGKLIQVQVTTGAHFYAPIVTLGVSASLPSELWISTHKNDFLALLTYEGDSYNSPIIIGFLPLKTAESKKYNTNEKLLSVVSQLLDTLSNARVLTQLGPQSFLPDSLLEIKQLQEQIATIQKDIR